MIFNLAVFHQNDCSSTLLFVLGVLYYHLLTVIPALISIIARAVKRGMKVLIYSHTSTATVGIWAWISNSMLHCIYKGCSYLCMLKLKLIHASKGDPKSSRIPSKIFNHKVESTVVQSINGSFVITC